MILQVIITMIATTALGIIAHVNKFEKKRLVDVLKMVRKQL